MRANGFTLIEMLTVITVIVVVTAITLPGFRSGMQRQSVRSARNAVTSMHAKARATAIYRGRKTVLHLGNVVVIRSTHPVSGAVDTVGVPEDLRDRYHVSVYAEPDSVVFDPRGFALGTDSTVVRLKNQLHADTIWISRYGRVTR